MQHTEKSPENNRTSPTHFLFDNKNIYCGYSKLQKNRLNEMFLSISHNLHEKNGQKT